MNVRHLTFRLLQVYATVIETGSITRAAAQLHLTQPTVSQQLKRLSQTVGADLLVHQGGAYVPTQVGEALFFAARDVLSRFDELDDLLHQLRRGVRGRFSIGLVTTAQYLLPRILGRFSQAFPDIEVTLNIGNRGRILDRHRHGQDDLYLFSHPPGGINTLASRFLKNPLVLLAPPGHWAAGQRNVDFAALAHERFLLREPGSATEMMFESWLREAGIRLAQTMQIESNEAIRMGVASGLGLAVLSEHSLAASADPLEVLDVVGFPLDSAWYLVCDGSRRLPPSALQFLHYLEEHVAVCIGEEYVIDELTPLLERLDQANPL